MMAVVPSGPEPTPGPLNRRERRMLAALDADLESADPDRTSRSHRPGFSVRPITRAKLVVLAAAVLVVLGIALPWSWFSMLLTVLSVLALLAPVIQAAREGPCNPPADGAAGQSPSDG